jgi:uncharacterized membrane protein YagU involved in acid resistance
MDEKRKWIDVYILALVGIPLFVGILTLPWILVHRWEVLVFFSIYSGVVAEMIQAKGFKNKLSQSILIGLAVGISVFFVLIPLVLFGSCLLALSGK